MPYLRKTADIHISDELTSVLMLMKDNSEVAKLLLKFRHGIEDLVDNYVNYIAISKGDKTKISYLSQDRFDKVDDYWNSSQRYSVKAGTFIKKLFKNISDKEVEKFASMYKSIQLSPEFKFKVVEGNDILKYYLYDTYSENSSSLGASCMKHNNCQEFLFLYRDNPEIIKMLVMLDREGRLLGRTLLWMGDKIMDRIYTVNDDEYTYHFKKWADDNDFLYKKEQRWNNTLYFESKGKPIFKEMSVKLKNHSYSRYPYLDTFKFYNVESGTFYNYIPKDIDVYTLSQPDGSKQDCKFLQIDGKTKLFHHRGELIWVPYLEYHTSSNNLYFSEINDTYILREDSKYDEEIGDYIFIQSDKNDESRYNDRKEYMRKQKEQDEERRSKKINPKYSQQLFGSFYGDYVRQIERMTRDVIESESDSVEV